MVSWASYSPQLDHNPSLTTADHYLECFLSTGGRNTATESETENENTNPAVLTGDSKINNSNSNAAGVVGALQDGDSNFVSNDSTSQEPIIDDNDGTTQTTATTTSTEDGEPAMSLGIGIGIGIGIGMGVSGGGTPLASDSESNLEAPLKANSLTSLNQPAAAAAPAQPTSHAPSQQPHNNNKQITNNGQVASPGTEAGSAGAVPEVKPTSKVGVAANGNGNGNGVLGDGEDEDEEELEEEDEDENENEAEIEADESNSSNGIVRDSKLQQLQVVATNKAEAAETETPAAAAAAAAAGDDGVVVAAIGQKRSALHCDMELKNAGGGGGVGEKSPELKKLRSE